MLGNNAFWKFDTNRVRNGYKSAWLVKDPEDKSGKFSLIGLTTSVPYPYGEPETSEIDVLQSPNIGLISGKVRLETTDVPVYHHRDNAYRYEKLEGKVLQFMSINAEFVGYVFSGTLKYIPDTAENTENTATVRVTPASATEKSIKNARPFIIESFCFRDPIPETVKTGEEVDFSVKENATPTYVINKITTDSSTMQETETIAELSTDYTLTGSKITFNTEGLYVISATSPTNEYAPWTTTVYVEA